MYGILNIPHFASWKIFVWQNINLHFFGSSIVYAVFKETK